MDATPAQLIAWVSEARQRTLQLVADLDDDQLLGPRLDIVNPLLWEIGHVAWFQEKWVLRRGGEPPIRADADDLYDSAAVAHDRRWDLPLPDREDTLRYMAGVLERVAERCSKQNPEDAYFVRCDETTMTADDVQNGRLICEIGVAIVRPAEFVIFRIEQITGFAKTT